MAATYNEMPRLAASEGPRRRFLDKGRLICQRAAMNWMNEIANVLQNYSQSGQAPEEGQVADHFQQVSQVAPASDLAGGLAAMFQSDQTPPFGQMIGNLFQNSNNNQRASLLNTLLSSGAASGVLSQLMQSAGLGGRGGAGGAARITPEAAGQVTSEMAQQAAENVEKHDPSIVDRVSQIYAEHPMLVKTLGAAAMSIALSHLSNRRR